MINDLQTIEGAAQSLDGPRGTVYQGTVLVPPGAGASSVRLPDGRVVTVVVQNADDATDLAAARIARSPSDLLAADAKPVAHAVADALVAAGLGDS